MTDSKRQKMNTPSNVRLLEVQKCILEKYKGLSRNGKVFSISSKRHCNNILRKIGLNFGIKIKPISSSPSYHDDDNLLIERSSHRDSQSHIGTYEHKNDTDIC